MFDVVWNIKSSMFYVKQLSFFLNLIVHWYAGILADYQTGLEM
jgi:hypothetical protein